MSKLITVIVPVYNAEAYLSCCLASITEQSYRELEILLIDDGSTDGSARVCQNWCERDGRCRFFHQENRGVSAARNRGLEEAGGAYIAFVDADDWILPGMLEKQLVCLEREGSDMVLCGFRETGEAERAAFWEGIRTHGRFGEDGSEEAQQAPSCVTMDAQTYAQDYLLNGNNRCWSVLFSRRVLGMNRFLESLAIGEDLLFLVDLLPSLALVSVMESREYCYYINEKGAMYSGFRPSYMDQLRCWRLAEERLERLFPSCLPAVERGLFQAAVLVAGKLALGQGRAEEKAGADGQAAVEAAGRPETGGQAANHVQVAGQAEKGAQMTAGNSQESRWELWLRDCHRAAGDAWKRLGRSGRRKLPADYRIKGPVFLHAPKTYLRLYHIWKGRK